MTENLDKQHPNSMGDSASVAPAATEIQGEPQAAAEASPLKRVLSCYVRKQLEPEVEKIRLKLKIQNTVKPPGDLEVEPDKASGIWY